MDSRLPGPAGQQILGSGKNDRISDSGRFIAIESPAGRCRRVSRQSVPRLRANRQFLPKTSAGLPVSGWIRQPRTNGPLACLAGYLGTTLHTAGVRTRGRISPLAMIMRLFQTTGIVVTWFCGVGPAEDQVSHLTW